MLHREVRFLACRQAQRSKRRWRDAGAPRSTRTTMRSTCLSIACAAALLAAAPLSAHAQVVRGTARDRATGTPIPGVLVTLEAAGGGAAATSPDRSALTDTQGGFALRAPQPGRYRLSARRIGVQRHLTEPFSLEAGETRQLDLDLDATVRTLEEVVVTAEGLCITYRNEGRQVTAMWDDIRTALAATTISARDSLVTGRVERYARLLDPRNLRVQREARDEHQGFIHRPFSSPSADSLSEHGYWGPTSGDTLAFFGPDVEVLASDAFRRDHCFSVARGRREREGMIGLAFEPAPGRKVADLRGTLWLDAQSSALRLVEFQYTRLPRIPHVEQIRGEVHFSRLPSGAWIVRRWYIRMPRYAYAAHRAGRSELWSSQGFQLPRIDELLEEGGSVENEVIRQALERVVVRGTAHDSAGVPFVGARVRIAGTEQVATVDSAGQFVLDDVSPGFFVLVVEHEGYARYGVPAAEADLLVEPGKVPAVSLRAFNASAVATRMCAGRSLDSGRAAVYLTMVDSTSGRPIAGERVRLRWTEYEAAATGGVAVRRARPVQVNGTTDEGGAVTVCGVPTGVVVEIGFPLGDSELRRVGTHQVPPGQVWALQLRVARAP